MYLLIGLGNPGRKFLKNRHNVGFMIIDSIATKNEFPKFKKKNVSCVSVKIVQGKKIILLKPNTYMNNSGLSAIETQSFYKIKNENIFVFHDEIDLEVSKIKIKTGGSNIGHNGLKSLDNHIGNNYNRIRIGVGRPLQNLLNKQEEHISKWVLSDFSLKDNETWLHSTIEKTTYYFEDLLDKNFNKFLMNIYN